MKVLVIATNRERFPYGVPPLGAASIVATLNKNGVDAELLDLYFSRRPAAAARRALKKFRPDIVGLSIRNLDNCSCHAPDICYREARQVAETVRASSDALLIAGGSAVSVGQNELLEDLGIDLGIAGEGEPGIVPLITALRNRGSLDGIPGLIRRGPEGLVRNALSFTCNLDTVPLNIASGIAYSRYFRKGGFVSIQTRRGCPYRCIYCSYPALEGSTYRLRSPGQCVDDIEKIVTDRQWSDFYFVDSVFNLPPEHAAAICEEIIRRRLKIRWVAYCNPLHLDREMARLFRASGCAAVELGLDAVTDKMLTAMGKCFAQDDMKQAFDALQYERIPYAVFLLFGGPGDTWQDVRNTQRFLETNSKANAVFASIGIRIYRDTPMYNVAVEEGVITAKTNLLAPVFYVSPELGKEAAAHLDRIACESHTWITPTDWNSRIIRGIQALAGRLRSIPAWKNVAGYGKHMRKHFRRNP